MTLPRNFSLRPNKKIDVFTLTWLDLFFGRSGILFYFLFIYIVFNMNSSNAYLGSNYASL